MFKKILFKSADKRVHTLALNDTNAANERMISEQTNPIAYVLTPYALSPSGESGIMPDFIATAYQSIFSKNNKKERVFQICPVNSKWDEQQTMEFRITDDILRLTNATSLLPKTSYKWRCKDISLWGDESAWSNVLVFTTNAGIKTAPAPKVIANCDIPEITCPQCDNFDVFECEVYQRNRKVWSCDNVNAIKLPAGNIKPSAHYVFKLRAKNKQGQHTDWRGFVYKAAEDFGHIECPKVLVADKIAAGSNFKVTSGQDVHSMTDWLIYDTKNVLIWSSLNDKKNLNIIDLPKKLEAEQQYTLKMRYKGERCDWSDYAITEFELNSKQDSSDIQLTISDPQDEVLSRFSGIGTYVDNHIYSNWILRNARDNTIVWCSLGDTTNRRSIVVDYDLESRMEYRLYVQYCTSNGLTDFASIPFVSANDQTEYLHIKVKSKCTFTPSDYMLYSGDEWLERKYEVYVDDKQIECNIFKDSFDVPNGDIKIKGDIFPILRFANCSDLLEVKRPLPKMQHSATNKYSLTLDTFYNAQNVTYLAPAPLRNINTHMTHIKSANGLLYNLSKLQKFPLGLLTIAKNTIDSCRNAFAYCPHPDLNIFCDCRNIKNIEECFRGSMINMIDPDFMADLSNCKNIDYVFCTCKELKTIPKDTFRNCPIETAKFAFSCAGLEKIDGFLSSDTVQDIQNCFEYCNKLKTVQNAFTGCKGITTAQGCFYSATSLETVDINLLADAEQLENISDMFKGSGCSPDLKLTSRNITNADNFAYQCKTDSIGTLLVPAESTSYETLLNAVNRNTNIASY